MVDQKQKLTLRLENDVINGFSYSFCKALVDELEKRWEKDNFYQTSKDVATTETTYNSDKNAALPTVTFAIEQLRVQMPGICNGADYSINPDNPLTNQVPKFLDNARSILSIFEKEE